MTKWTEPDPYLAERWHKMAEETPGRDGLTLFLVITLLFAIFCIIGYGAAMYWTR